MYTFTFKVTAVYPMEDALYVHIYRRVCTHVYTQTQADDRRVDARACSASIYVSHIMRNTGLWTHLP